MKVLVVLEVSPEETKFYIIDMTESQYMLFSKVDNYIVNAYECDAEKDYIVNLFGHAVCDCEEYRQYCESEQEKDMFGIWADKEVASIKDLSEVEHGISLGFCS